MKQHVIWQYLFIIFFLGFSLLPFSAFSQEKKKVVVKEALEALALEGDADDGEDVFEICAACHLESGWGDRSGTFPQLAGQQASFLITQIADIRAKHRINPTMFPFASQLDGPQDLADVALYLQHLKMNPAPTRGPGGPSFVLTNLRKKTSSHSLDAVTKIVGQTTGKNLQSLKNKKFKSKAAFLATAKKAIGGAPLKKHRATLLTNADWSTDLKLGKAKYEKDCVKCHMEHGQGSYKERYPALAGQNYMYMIRQMTLIRSKQRKNADQEMVDVLKNYSELEMRSTVDYASRFKMTQGDWNPQK